MKFEEIKENKYEFMEIYMNLYQNFENIESIKELEKNNINENKEKNK